MTSTPRSTTPTRRPPATEPMTEPRRPSAPAAEDRGSLPPLLERWYLSNYVLFPTYEIAAWGIKQKYGIEVSPLRLSSVVDAHRERWQRR